MKYIIYIFVFSLYTVSLFAETPTNMQLLDSLTSELPKNIKADFADVSEVKLDFNKHPNAWFIEQKIVNSKLFKIVDSDSVPKLSVLLSEFGVRYTRLNNDSLEREVKIKYEAVLYDNGITKPHDGKEYIFRDSVAEKDLAIIESSAYPFSKSPVPEQNKSWLDEALEPAILVGSAALTVILFFTVRSN